MPEKVYKVTNVRLTTRMGAEFMKIYGYCRVSTPKQNIVRQVENISKAYPTAEIILESYTGKIMHRPKWNSLVNHLESGDVLVFDSVSRMSRNAAEGTETYLKLFERGIEMHFLKEPLIDSSTYKSALNNSVALTGGDVDYILIGINNYLKSLATRQIELAFKQSEKEVTDLHQRTSEGLRVAKANGKRVGQPKGAKLVTKKSIAAKAVIKQHSRSFGGSLSDAECAKLAGISRNTFYRYKSQIKGELAVQA